jgi:hypothetical protein
LKRIASGAEQSCALLLSFEVWIVTCCCYARTDCH